MKTIVENGSKCKKQFMVVSVILVFVMVISYVGYLTAADKDLYPFTTGTVGVNAEVILWPYLTYEYIQDRSNPNNPNNPYNQRSYMLPYVGNVTVENYGCVVVCDAIGSSIMDRKSHSPKEFMRDKNDTFNPLSNNSILESRFDFTEKNKQEGMLKIYNAIKSGKPVRFFIGIKSSDDGHAVIINGYKTNTNPQQLFFTDFLCIDPYSGKEVNLTDAWGWSRKKMNYCSMRVYKKQ